MTDINGLTPSTHHVQSPRATPPSVGDILLRAASTLGIPVFVTGPYEDSMPMLWANAAFEHYSGIRFADLAGESVRKLAELLVEPDDLDRLTEVVASGQEAAATIRSPLRGGRFGWAQLTLTPARAGHDDKVTHWIGFSVDVSGHMEQHATQLASLELERQQREDLDLIAQTTEILTDLEYPYALRDIGELLGTMVRWAGFYVNDDGLMHAEGIDVGSPPSGRGRRHARYIPGDDPAQHAHRQRRVVTDALGDVVGGSPAPLLEVVDSVQDVLDGVLDGPVTLHLDIAHAPYSASGWLQRDLSRRVAEETGELPQSVVVHGVAGRRQVLGVLVVWPHEPTADDLMFADGTDEPEAVRSVVEVVARRAGSAIDNARMYAREHRLAETLQRAMLPEQADVAGLDVWTYYAPNAEHAQVGGDWYDVLQIAPELVGIVIGDVVGHDVEAAATMGQLRSVVRSYAFELSRPGEVLQRVDQLVAGMGIPRSASMVYAALRREEEEGRWTIQYSRAGHLPPLLLRDGEIIRLDDGGGALIGFGSRERSTGEHGLQPGDTLLFYTDGLIERRDRSLRLGLEVLLDTASAITARDAAGVGEELLSRLADAPEDDVAIVVVRIPDPVGDAREPALSPRWRRWLLPSEPSSIGRARHAVLRTCQAWGIAESAAAELVVSELVANGVLHGWGHISLRLFDTGDGLRIEVEDSNPAPPVSTDGHPNRLGGFGMQIVERLAEWGWRPAGSGKLVWAKLRQQPQRAT
ncbi:SpoIIE family protein phosphatase [Antribacter gilvus]|uniref:SpoIIE family protein phosphatase n=1 Tax=Antribacter gilvus TaxID=2304675 RepID=UPI000F799421|nr:SpoIIE family protein phosphatase [Antribacter gilvus]